MNLERYEILKLDNEEILYEFVSSGSKGNIKKAVLFTETDIPDFYNLGFGDINEESKEIDDLTVSDNGDTQLILATIAAIVILFTQEYPGTKVYAVGSTPSRTRLYRMGITSHFEEMITLFDVYGFRHEIWEPFMKGGDYEAFYVQRKK